MKWEWIKNKDTAQYRCFTLVELMMVTGIIATIAALILVAYNGFYNKWSIGNTVATMNRAALALDKFRLENGYLPVFSDEMVFEILSPSVLDNDSTSLLSRQEHELAVELFQLKPFALLNKDDEHPEAKQYGEVTVIDDFGRNEPIYYVYPCKDTLSFGLFSLGKDGKDNTGDEIIFLPASDKNATYRPGAYIGTFRLSDHTFSLSDSEPISQ